MEMASPGILLRQRGPSIVRTQRSRVYSVVAFHRRRSITNACAPWAFSPTAQASKQKVLITGAAAVYSGLRLRRIAFPGANSHNVAVGRFNLPVFGGITT